MLDLDRKYFRGRALPEVVPQDIKEIAKKGYKRIGVIAFFVNSKREVLMLSHKKSEKTPAGKLGPMGETAEATFDSESQVFEIEQPTHCLVRGMAEELAIAPEYIEHRGYFLSPWGAEDPGGLALAICPVIDCGEGSWILSNPDTEEIARAQFMSFEEIDGLPDMAFRHGVKRLVGELQEFLSRPVKSRQRVHLRPLQLRLGEWKDAQLNQIGKVRG